MNYHKYKDVMQKIADVKYASAVLQWDQETYLPAGSHETRGRQIATLNELAHERFTAPAVGELLAELSGSKNLSPRELKNVQLSCEDFEKSQKLPSAFVCKMSEAVNKSFHSWISARRQNDFRVFEGPLQEIISLKKQEADLLGYSDHPYDALMNDYDKGLTVEKTDRLFSELRPQLSALLSALSRCSQPDNSFLRGHFDKGKQWEAGLEMLKRMGFDFSRGRQDISEHPFTTSFGSTDVRVTTRIDENDFGNMMWSCIHEGGHALYEQGLPDDEYGLPSGEYCSLSIHESQSRLWENCIGRSEAFWKHNLPFLQTVFPAQLGAMSVQDFFRGINPVQPSLIRTEADEITYHFHVMIRYEIEKLLLEGAINSNDVPAYWNEHYKKYLGVIVPDDLHGCLQDVHWSHGSFGYFATYSIGSLYAAQFFHAMRVQMTDLESEIARGNNKKAVEWLRQNIHSYGRFYDSADLCRLTTGSELSSSFFLSYITDKYARVYTGFKV